VRANTPNVAVDVHHVRRWLRVSTAAALTIGLTCVEGTAQAPSLDRVLARAGEYVSLLHAELSGIVAEETYVQQIRPGGSRLTQPLDRSRRTLKSDLLLVMPAGSTRYLEFRDVFEVDGSPVRDRQERLTKLFLDPAATADQQIRRIIQESARHNIGDIQRNINTPMLVVSFLDRDTQPRFRFRRVAGSPPQLNELTLDGRGDTAVFRASTEMWTIEFRETKRPTIIRTNAGRDYPAAGRVWLDPETGAVLMSELKMDNGDVGATINVSYQSEPVLGFLVPVEMRERYQRSGESIEGVATYGRFRRFQVNTKEVIGKPPGWRH
jgi:hypothetical protein